ncbi:hypothetical protein QE152_g23654 [Popillia japonica]|uniref:Uncharacterized protein n=1 Tax=Popillia japonica TaxID=7064 RepID=A0AAW1KH56_POPJA
MAANVGEWQKSGNTFNAQNMTADLITAEDTWIRACMISDFPLSKIKTKYIVNENIKQQRTEKSIGAKLIVPVSLLPHPPDDFCLTVMPERSCIALSDVGLVYVRDLGPQSPVQSHQTKAIRDKRKRRGRSVHKAVTNAIISSHKPADRKNDKKAARLAN